MATMEDIAKKLSLSKGTVSKALNGAPDISEATIENVLGKMVKDGAVEKTGAGRSTAYIVRK